MATKTPMKKSLQHSFKTFFITSCPKDTKNVKLPRISLVCIEKHTPVRSQRSAHSRLIYLAKTSIACVTCAGSEAVKLEEAESRIIHKIRPAVKSELVPRVRQGPQQSVLDHHDHWVQAAHNKVSSIKIRNMGVPNLFYHTFHTVMLASKLLAFKGRKVIVWRPSRPILV